VRANGLESFLVTQDAIPARPNGSINRNSWGIPSLPDRRTAMIDGRQPATRAAGRTTSRGRSIAASAPLAAGRRFGTSRSRGRSWQRLDAMPEGDGSVLDHSCQMFISSMRSGTKHDNRKVPVISVGGLGGTRETGRVLDYLKAGDHHRQLCSLYLGIMDRKGVHLDHFGDARSRLVGF
jgi:hypothetical protein